MPGSSDFPVTGYSSSRFVDSEASSCDDTALLLVRRAPRLVELMVATGFGECAT